MIESNVRGMLTILETFNLILALQQNKNNLLIQLYTGYYCIFNLGERDHVDGLFQGGTSDMISVISTIIF